MRSRVFRSSVVFAVIGTFAELGWGAPKKPPKPAPVPTTPPSSASSPSAVPAPSDDARAEYAVCPAGASVVDLEPKAVVTLLKNKCRTLRVPSGAAPTEVGVDDLLIVACVREGEATTPSDCGLRAFAQRDGKGVPIEVALVADGELALSLRASSFAKEAAPQNGDPFRLVVVEHAGEHERTSSSPLVWREPQSPYGGGAFVWLPIPMLTTDFSSGPKGYRLGVTPLAIAVGTRFFPSATSHGYFGASLFAAWNLLVPNDTQTLSNTTAVRINYESFGGGALFDASGWISLGVGVGHTFTTDGRTDFRAWFYFGPRLLSFGNDY